MSMKYRIAAVVILIAAMAMAGCDRGDRNVTPSISLEKLPAQAERQIEKAGVVLDDATVTAKVKVALIAEPKLKGLAIDVDTSRNVVTLNGSVASDDLRREAEQVAGRIDGVKEVKNNLTVKPAS